MYIHRGTSFLKTYACKTRAVNYSKSMQVRRMKYRIVHFLQKYFLNPQIKILFAIGVVPPGHALLETTGRKTARPRRTPVGDGRVGSQFWLIAEHGMRAGYVRNIANNPRVRLKIGR